MSTSSSDPQTILFLAANPKDTGRLRLDQELRDISDGLQRAQKREQFRLEQRLAVRSQDIQRALLDVGPTIIHFSGHGAGEEGLVFEDEMGHAKLVNGAALAGLFELFADQIQCVVLNGCYSEVQAKAIAQHIPYVIGMNQAIGDTAAIAFAVGFYDALGAGRDVEFVYKLGCAAIRMAGVAEHLTPVFLSQQTTATKSVQSAPMPQAPAITTAPIMSDSQPPLEAFISFSHQDDALQAELLTHLSNLKRQKKIAAWYDRAVEAGEEWDAQIRAKLESAPIILLLISPPFMASDYCYDIEMQRAMQRHDEGTARVIPVILRPCDWRDSPFSKLKALPEDGKPVTQWGDRDAAFLDVVQGIRRAVESLSKRVVYPRSISTTTLEERRISLPLAALHKEVEIPFISGNPIVEPRHFFGREKEIKRLFTLLKTHPLQSVAVIGKLGSGKTSLLNYLRKITVTPTQQLRLGQRCDWMQEAENYRWAFIDFQDSRLSSRKGVLAHILKCLRLPTVDDCSLEYFMDVMSDNLNCPTVILLDEISVGLQRCPELNHEFWESLRSLACTYAQGNLSFVLASSELPMNLANFNDLSLGSPLWNIFGYNLVLKPFTLDESIELLENSPILFSDKDMEWITSVSRGWPLLLQILSRVRLLSLLDGENSEFFWREEGLRQINQFKYLLDE